jgi:hypothetical protein
MANQESIDGGLQKLSSARHHLLKPVILASWEAEIRRITV